MELYETPEEYTKTIFYDSDREEQVRISVNTFRYVEYLSVRKYYLDFNGEWSPSNVGVTLPLTIENSKEMFRALIEILSLAESKEVIEEHFKGLIHDIYI